MNNIPLDVLITLDGRYSKNESVQILKNILMEKLNLRGKEAKKYAKMWKKMMKDLKE